MKASTLLFKRRISILGLCLFVVVTLSKTYYKIFRWTIKSSIGIVRWIRHYYHFVNAGYSYSDVLNIINNMTGREFEKFCYYLFKELGYDCKLTQASADGGKDLILYDEENGYTYVECKRWSGEGSFKVGRPELQKLIGAAIGDNISNTLFINTGKYTNEAYEYASSMDNLELWSMKDIMKMIYKVNQNRIPHILAKSLNYTNTKVIRLKPI